MGRAAFRKQVDVILEDDITTYGDDVTEVDGIVTEATNVDAWDWNQLPATTANMTAEGDVLDDTDLRTTGSRSRIVGLLDWGVDGTLNFEPAISGYADMKSAFYGRKVVWVRYRPDPSTPGTGFCGPCVVASFGQSGGVEDLETVDFTLESNGILLDDTGSTL